jgi:hypothetical protein
MLCPRCCHRNTDHSLRKQSSERSDRTDLEDMFESITWDGVVYNCLVCGYREYG